jgi:alpha-amylase
MKKICLNIEVHQPRRFQIYRFSEIDKNHHYYDDYENEYYIRKLSDNCYLPVNSVLSDLIHYCKKDFKISFLFSGVVLDLFEMYATDMLESFKSLIDTGCVELLSGTYSSPFMPMIFAKEYHSQIELHKGRIKSLFGIDPRNFQCSNFDNQTYNLANPGLRILSGNARLNYYSPYIMSPKNQVEWLLKPEKLVKLLNKFIKEENDTINLFLRFDIYGDSLNINANLIEFLQLFTIEVFSKSDYSFGIPSETEANSQSTLRRKATSKVMLNNKRMLGFTGNEFQNNAFDELYSLRKKIEKIDDQQIKKDWLYLQSCDHFLFMDPKIYKDKKLKGDFFPYETHFLAYINYKNILMDFSDRLSEFKKESDENREKTKDAITKRGKDVEVHLLGQG